METQNIRLSLVRKARHVAVERGVSLSALVGSCLEEVVAPEQSMAAVSYASAQSNLAKTMDRVCDNHEPLIITRSDGPSVVMISLQDYRALEETAYLLRSPRNALRLLEAIADLEGGRGRGSTP